MIEAKKLKEDFDFKYEKKSNLFRKISYAFYHNKIVIGFSLFRTGMKNLWKWRKIVWKDRDWDHSYLEDMMLFKLDSMEKFFRSPDCHIAEWETVANEIAGVRELLKKTRVDGYEEELDPHFYDAYHGSLIKDGVWGLPQRSEQELEKIRAIYKVADENRMADRVKLYNIIATRGMGWWD